MPADELFSLTMEFIAMEYWDVFFQDKLALLAAKLSKMEGSLKLFKMVGLVDSFQTWAYLNPAHSITERNQYWARLLEEFNTGFDDKTDPLASWQRYSLLYRAPFYMVEYAIATLGALSIYKEFKSNKQVVIDRLIKAMKLGNTVSLQEIYHTAGVDFDFSKQKVNQVADFIREEWNSLKLELENSTHSSTTDPSTT